MASAQRIFAISCLALLLMALGFQPLQAQTDENGCPTGKSSWPELVGVEGYKAAAQIEAENSALDAVVISKDAVVATIYICTRVYVRVDSQGIVSSTPIIG
ncbi:serine protease inhibitor [Paucibacter sp. DJ4R-1]|nr:serine protease inhibitor [Paucibacter sp. DJ4R-1]